MDRQAELLLVWRYKVERASSGHYLAAGRAKRLERLWSCFNILTALSTTVAGALDIGLQLPPLTYVIVVASVFTVGSSVAQIIYNFGEAGARHVRAGADYADLGRDIEEMAASPDKEHDLAYVKAKLNSLSGLSPDLPKSIVSGKALSEMNKLVHDAKTELFRKTSADGESPSSATCAPQKPRVGACETRSN